jgi:hypothetical protein
MKRFPWLLACVTALLTAPSAQAQTVSDVVGFLMTNQAVPTSSFERDRAAAESARDTIIQALQVNLASTPLASSSSGFLYRFNPQLGTAERATETFGGFFVERALTAGAGRLSFGFSTASASFDQLDGRNLRDGSLVTIANQFPDENAPFEEELLTLRIRSVTTTFNASVGVNSRLEVGAAVPVMRLTLDGTRVYTYHGVTSAQAAGSSTASGFGDVALRAKYQLVAAPKGGLAVATELRLPTGDEENLLGAGTAALRVSAVGSLERGAAAVNVNGGFLRGGVSDEWTGAAGLAVAVAPRVTLVGEVMGRYLSDLKEVTLTSTPHPEIAGANTLRLSAGPAGQALVDTLAGVKWNVASRLVIEAHARWAVRHYGLTSTVVPTIGFEYAF